MIIPTLCVGMPLVTLRVTLWDAERPELHSHAERGNDHQSSSNVCCCTSWESNPICTLNSPGSAANLSWVL
ncbi:hypothetical protein DJ480_04805 [Pseudomonas sp. Leaf98]|nr:hypothetical protein DJ480_04805 [Pseudomonas sp. Leaf98]